MRGSSKPEAENSRADRRSSSLTIINALLGLTVGSDQGDRLTCSNRLPLYWLRLLLADVGSPISTVAQDCRKIRWPGTVLVPIPVNLRRHRRAARSRPKGIPIRLHRWHLCG